MSLDARLETLENRHHNVEAMLHKEMSHPAADPAKVSELKREKLKLKDEIENLRTPAA